MQALKHAMEKLARCAAGNCRCKPSLACTRHGVRPSDMLRSKCTLCGPCTDQPTARHQPGCQTLAARALSHPPPPPGTNLAGKPFNSSAHSPASSLALSLLPAPPPAVSVLATGKAPLSLHPGCCCRCRPPPAHTLLPCHHSGSRWGGLLLARLPYEVQYSCWLGCPPSWPAPALLALRCGCSAAGKRQSCTCPRAPCRTPLLPLLSLLRCHSPRAQHCAPRHLPPQAPLLLLPSQGTAPRPMLLGTLRWPAASARRQPRAAPLVSHTPPAAGRRQWRPLPRLYCCRRRPRCSCAAAVAAPL